MSGQNSLKTKLALSMRSLVSHFWPTLGPGVVFGGIDRGRRHQRLRLNRLTSEKLKVVVAVVLTSDEDAGSGVEGALAEGSVAEGVEAIVLMEESWECDAADHEVFVNRVGESVPIVAGVTRDSLVESG